LRSAFEIDSTGFHLDRKSKPRRKNGHARCHMGIATESVGRIHAYLEVFVPRK
jgi:hypothetical protein